MMEFLNGGDVLFKNFFRYTRGNATDQSNLFTKPEKS